jgi:hypothetical protein
MKTYFRDNSRKVKGVINLMVDSNPKDVELKKQWKLNVLNPYIDFLSDLEIIKKYSWINSTSALKPHCDFIEKITTICENTKGDDLPSDKFNKHLNEMISDWLDNNLQSELKKEEKSFYIRMSWQDEPLENDEKKETPLQKKKAEAMISLNKNRKVNF